MSVAALERVAADGLAEGAPPEEIRRRLRLAGAVSDTFADEIADAVRASFAEFHPLHEPPVPAFQVDALPTWLRAWTRAESIATQTPPDLAGVLALAAVSSAVCGLACVTPSDGYAEPVHGYFTVALPPASRKTKVFSDSIEPILAWEAEAAKEARPFVARALERLEQERARLAELRKRAKDGDPAIAVEGQALAAAIAELEAGLPVIPRRVTDDVTPETLAGLLHIHGGRIALWAPEGGEFFEVARGRYAGNARPNVGVFLKAHAGDVLIVDRKRDRYIVERPALTIAAAIQTEALTALRDSSVFRERGLLARFLYSVPEPTVGARVWPAPAMSLGVRDDYAQCLGRLLRLPVCTDPLLVPLREDSRDLWLDFARELEPRLGESGDLAPIADWAGKLTGAVLRLAGLLHVAEYFDDPFADPIDATTMGRAIDLGTYFLGHAIRVFAAFDTDESVEGAQKAWRGIRRGGASCFTKRDLHQRVKGGRIRTLENLDAALSLLVAHGYIARIGGDGGSSRREEYAVNPEALGAMGASRER